MVQDKINDFLQMILLIGMLFKQYNILFAMTNKNFKDEIIFYYISSILCYLLENQSYLNLNSQVEVKICEVFFYLMKIQSKSSNIFNKVKKDLIKENTKTLKKIDKIATYKYFLSPKFRKFVKPQFDSLEQSTTLLHLYSVVSRKMVGKKSNMNVVDGGSQNKMKELYENLIINEKMFDIIKCLNLIKKYQTKE